MQETTTPFSFDTVKSQFLQEAESFLPKAMIEQTLSDEKRILENAAYFGIKPQKIINGNLLRHCKDMTRKNQPFFGFYLCLNFFTELSMLLFFFGIIFCSFRFVTDKNNMTGFTAPFSFLLITVLLAGLLLYNTISKMLVRKFLLTQDLPENSPASAALSDKQTGRKKINTRYVISFCLSALFCFIAILGIVGTGADKQYQATLFQLFMGYVFFISLSGVHNTLYNSHAISLLTIGGFVLTRRSDTEIHHAVSQYLHLNYLQLLGSRGKTFEDFKKDDILALEMKRSLRSRLITQRVYYALAILILFLLLGVCLFQIRYAFSIALLVFVLAILLGSVCLITAFVSANYVIKKLPK